MTDKRDDTQDYRYFNNIIGHYPSDLHAVMDEIKKEFMGYMAGTADIARLSEIGRSVDPRFDFAFQLSLLEADRESVMNDIVIYQDMIGRLEPVNKDIVQELESTLVQIKSEKAKHQRIARLIVEHNQSAQKYPFSMDGLAKVDRVGFFGRFNKEVKSVNRCLASIKEHFNLDYAGFYKLAVDTDNMIKDYTSNLFQKKLASDQFDEVTRKYEEAQCELGKTIIAPIFNKIIEDAVVDSRFIASFCTESKASGSSVVSAMFKYQLLTSLNKECVYDVEYLGQSNYSLEDGRNLAILSKGIKASIAKYEAVRNSFVAVDFFDCDSLGAMYKKYLVSVGKLTGLSFLDYRYTESTFDASAIKVDIKKQPSLEIIQSEVAQSAQGNKFSKLLHRETPKQHGSTLITG
jgi:hypothetical protein